jgi:hypothetical protein
MLPAFVCYLFKSGHFFVIMLLVALSRKNHSYIIESLSQTIPTLNAYY